MWAIDLPLIHLNQVSPRCYGSKSGVYRNHLRVGGGGWCNHFIRSALAVSVRTKLLWESHVLYVTVRAESTTERRQFSLPSALSPVVKNSKIVASCQTPWLQINAPSPACPTQLLNDRPLFWWYHLSSFSALENTA